MAKRILLLHILGLHLHLLLFCLFTTYAGAALSPWSSELINCTHHCGDITIPFPFGRDRSECFLDEWFEIDCQNESSPFLKKLKLEVINISFGGYIRTDQYTTLASPNVTIKFPITYSDPSCYPKAISPHIQPPTLQGSPFLFSSRYNIFAAVGCNVSAQMTTNHSFVGCEVDCTGGNFSRYSTCSGLGGCCQTTVLEDLQTFTVEFNNSKDDPQCNNYALLASESKLLGSSFTDLNSLKTEGHAPVELFWGISNDTDVGKVLYDTAATNYPPYNYTCGRYFQTNDTMILLCYCEDGYNGNPYLKDGCQDIDECKDGNDYCPPSKRCVNTPGSFRCVDPKRTLKLILIGIGSSLGALLLVLLSWWLYRAIKKRKEKKLKKKYFKRNGGLILQQQLLSSEGNVQKGKLFNEKEMRMATENFSEKRILGKGGQGTVYKGMLTDGRIVAIKKALVIDEGKVEQFINEVMILTQISHRNIVQLLGCCLETEIPLLVYEFIPNGNLYEYLHESNKEDPVSWEVRLQLATEIAGALFYLHSAASIPVYHRDIKSTNILLDENYRAKIADFGTSRLISLDQTHVTTLVYGTIGYVDPEFLQTNQFTDKSDVYSFGVVLVELLTRQKPISTMRMDEGIMLAAYFISAMENGHLFDILDAEVLDQGMEEQIVNTANLAMRCLHLHGRNRPTMREVAIELEGIKKLQQLPNIQGTKENHVQVQCQDIFRSTPTKLEIDTNIVVASDAQPLLHGRIW